MAAGRHLEICINFNTSRTVCPILTKFGMELRLDAPEIPDVPKPPFFKIQDGR